MELEYGVAPTRFITEQRPIRQQARIQVQARIPTVPLVQSSCFLYSDDGIYGLAEDVKSEYLMWATIIRVYAAPRRVTQSPERVLS